MCLWNCVHFLLLYHAKQSNINTPLGTISRNLVLSAATSESLDILLVDRFCFSHIDSWLVTIDIVFFLFIRGSSEYCPFSRKFVRDCRPFETICLFEFGRCCLPRSRYRKVSRQSTLFFLWQRQKVGYVFPWQIVFQPHRFVVGSILPFRAAADQLSNSLQTTLTFLVVLR